MTLLFLGYFMNGKLFTFPKPNPTATVRLFCFPYAGGSSAIFKPWINSVSDSIELVLVQLPGRGERLMESPLDSMEAIIKELMQHKEFITSKPYALFGHSLGSRIAYELALTLAQNEHTVPLKLYASASRAPHCLSTRPHLHNLPHNEFIQALHSLNGTPKEVLDNQELMELFLPLLRADFKIADTYLADQHPLESEIHVFHGVEDEIERDHVEAWQALTCKPYELTEFPGGHFFIHQHYNEMMKIINQQLAS